DFGQAVEAVVDAADGDRAGDRFVPQDAAHGALGRAEARATRRASAAQIMESEIEAARLADEIGPTRGVAAERSAAPADENPRAVAANRAKVPEDPQRERRQGNDVGPPALAEHSRHRPRLGSLVDIRPSHVQRLAAARAEQEE